VQDFAQLPRLIGCIGGKADFHRGRQQAKLAGHVVDRLQRPADCRECRL
jgi:hypothetical protein